MTPADTLAQIAHQISICQQCVLHSTRKLPVPGEGPSNAQIMLIGEGPGFYENEQGRPFVGAAGNFLSELLARAGLTREEVFITNVVKCRPPDNRDPLPEELAACRDYLESQIAAINPKVIVTLGRFSMAIFFPRARIGAVHGQASKVNGRIIVPMYHPAAALHQPALKSTVERDFLHLAESIKQNVPARPVTQAPAAQSEDPADSATQLSLF
ncbi:uracil-DNA glycosylase [Leptolinea tardivitalis]|uniref:Type-4 uracil-DNA glycosylase n=1 Tax=Leptolinea tardivitalis TaxID=229920 RepID=A0A0P6WW54_9CHLR|nr:uracil-DNA glycosylase [Leptolinea tardivitalis]KPL70243.1 uracil-DNA glycosylase [Leptolinea tardivitalis]GAP21791.1 uracil-DNA glycosylase, family 4 [Leptolinea tardivitalis]